MCFTSSTDAPCNNMASVVQGTHARGCRHAAVDQKPHASGGGALTASRRFRAARSSSRRSMKLFAAARVLTC